MHVPFVDLRTGDARLRQEFDAAYRRVMDSGWYILGPEVEAFEREFAEYCGRRHAVGVGNGLDALRLTLAALGVGPGDEVVVPANTYIATWLAVSAVGARPVPVEPDPATHTIDASQVESALTDRTRVILPVHLYGQPAEMDRIGELAGRHGLSVVTDAAQAHGGRYRGSPVGAFGDAACFSFYPTKNLGAFGDAGAVVTDDDQLAEAVRLLRNYGSRERYRHELRGGNSRLDELQAAFLRVSLSHSAEHDRRRTEIAGHYLADLAHLAGVSELTLPRHPGWADPAWHLFVIRHPRRAELRQRLADEGVATLIHYPTPPHLSRAYADHHFTPGMFPVTEELADQVLSLPLRPHLERREADWVTSAVARACAAVGPVGDHAPPQGSGRSSGL